MEEAFYESIDLWALYSNEESQLKNPTKKDWQPT